MTQFLLSHGIEPQFLFGVAVGMTIGLLTRALEYFVTWERPKVMRHYQAFSNMEDAMKWARKFKIEKVDRVGDVIMLGPMDDEQYIELISSISTAPLKSEK